MVANHRETVSGITHLIASMFAGIGLIWLLSITRDSPSQMVMMFVYGMSLIGVFAASTRLHLSNGTQDYMLKLRRQDHAAIYFVMAGTYTPFVVILIDGIWQWVILFAVWTMCLIGIYWKLRRLNRGDNMFISTGLYLLVGWCCVLCAPLWVPQLDMTTLGFIFGGGIVYSIGSAVFVFERPNLATHFGFHELWHLIVMLASLLHFIAIARIVTMV
jgi:hemolysin III